MEVGVFGVFGTPAELELALRGEIFRGAVIGAALWSAFNTTPPFIRLVGSDERRGVDRYHRVIDLPSCLCCDAGVLCPDEPFQLETINGHRN